MYEPLQHMPFAYNSVCLHVGKTVQGERSYEQQIDSRQTDANPMNRKYSLIRECPVATNRLNAPENLDNDRPSVIALSGNMDHQAIDENE